jgi:hypothetical protein
MFRKSQVLPILRISASTWVLVVTFLAIIGISGCANPPKSVSVSAAATTVDPNDSTTLTATVTHDSDSKGVSWTVSGGGTLSNENSSSATFTAPAATANAQSATVTATSVADPTKSATATITVPAEVTVTTGALPPALVGSAYSQLLAASGGISPYSWTISSGTLPSCLTMTSAGVISGTPVASCVGTTTGLVFKVTDSGTTTPLSGTSVALSLNVAPAPSIQLPALGLLSNGVVGTSYNVSVAASGGAGTLSYSISGGALPGGLTINAAGAITGTPTTPGSFSFIVKASDAFGDSQTQPYTIIVNYPPLGINPPGGALPFAFTGSSYSQYLSAGGGSGSGYVWTVVGLPADGIIATPSGNALLLSGTPASPATISFTASFKDGAGNTVGPFQYTISVYNPLSLPATNPPSLPSTTSVNAPYSGTITATGGRGSGYTWTVTGLADGLTSSNTGGVLTISGTPTTASTVTFQVSVKDSSGSSTGPITYTITVNSVLTLPATNPGTLSANAIVGTAYSGTITATGGSGSGYVFTVTGLPSDGLSSSASGGTLTISGTPTTAATITVNVSVKDSLGNTAGPITYTINAYNPIVLPASPGTLPSTGTVGVPYSGTIVITGGSGSGYTFTVTGLPADALTSSSSGATLTISGTPTSAGPVTFQVSVKDSAGNTAGPTTYTINVYNPLTLPAANPGTLGEGIVGTAYSGTVTASGGSGSGYVWTVTGLPADGLNFSTNGTTLTVTGTPTSATTVTFTASVKDSAGNSSGPTIYTIPVYNPIVLPASPGTLPSTGTVSVVYSGTIVATGGSGSGYVWTVTGLSDGLTSSTSGATLTITGTPTSAATVTFTASVKDSAGNTAGPITYTVNVYAGLTLPTPNPNTLGPGTVGAAYTGTVTVGGGSGSGYVWTVTGFPSDGLNYSTNGATLTVTGTPTSATTVSFNASVKDSANNTTGTITYTIPVYNTLTLPTPNPSTLPSNATIGTAYSGTIVAAGGSGSGYVFTVTGLADGLSYTSNGATLTISGTPTTASTISFMVSVKDSANDSAGPLTYTINASNTLTLPTPNPNTLPSATTNQAYQGSINASGGVLPLVWTVNGSVVPNNGTPVALSGGQGLTVSASSNNVLSFAGTPTAVANVIFTVQATDSANHSSGTLTYNIQINASGSAFSGQISLINFCGSSPALPTFTVSINTTPVQTTTTDSNGNYSFASIPDGNYTITPSIVGPSSVFYPATLNNVAVNNGTVQGVNFQVALGYTVSGNVSYSGAKTGQVYLNLNSNNCGGGGGLGTSIPFSSLSSGGAFNIHGVPPGSYTLTARMDNLGIGSANATNPTGSTGTLVVTTGNLTGAAITLTDPTLGAPTKAPQFSNVTPTNLGVVVNFNPIKNSNGIEAVTSYLLEWSTDPTFSTGINSITLNAVGTGSNVWFINNGTAGISGSFVNGTAYYFQARGQLAAGNGPFAVYGGGTPTAVTIGAPTAGNTVTGTITIPAGITPTGPLYAGFFDENTGAVFAEKIANPVTGANNYTVQVPTSTDPYFNFGILDQNNNGEIDLGDVSDTDNNGNNEVVINSNLSNQDVTLPSVNITPIVQTQFFSNINPGGIFPSYQLNFDLRAANLLPVSVELISGPNVISPMDIGACTGGCGHVQFQISASLDTDIPNVGDTYAFEVTYSNGAKQTVNGVVTGWAGTNSIVDSSDLASNLAPQGSGGSTSPTFTWNYPSNASSYTYDFQIYPSNGGNFIWQIPGEDSNLNGFPSTVTQIVWGTDPTGDTTNTPSPATLTNGTQYQWSIQVQDVNGNSATTQVYYTP